MQIGPLRRNGKCLVCDTLSNYLVSDLTAKGVIKCGIP